jgi:predicted SAM-dependent methyltransferase
MSNVIPFIHVCKRDEWFFAKWLRHARGLGRFPEMVIWAEPGVKVDHKIARTYTSNYGVPEASTQIWFEAVTTLGAPVLYLEPDAWPCAVNWFDLLSADYERRGNPPALVTASGTPPYDMVGGIGIYDATKLPLPKTHAEFQAQIRLGAAFDEWVGNLGPEKTALIRHSYGIYQGADVVGHHVFNSRAHFERICHGAAIFHKDAFGTLSRWVGPDSEPVALPGIGATPHDMSETAKHRDWFLPHIQGYGMDIGFGGDAIVPHAITFDMPQPYTSVGSAPQHLGGDCRKLPLKNDTLDWLYNSHLIEDFTYNDQIPMVQEWLRVLKPGGRLLILAPDQQRFLAHCAATGQSINDNHKEADYSLRTFRKKVLKTGNIRARVVAQEDFADYSWGIVLEKNL